MTVVRVKGFQIFLDRHNKPRCYHRATRTPIDLRKTPLGTQAFFAECARITEKAKITAPAKPGTLGMLIAGYKTHRAFTDLAPRTRSDHDRLPNFPPPNHDPPPSPL